MRGFYETHEQKRDSYRNRNNPRYQKAFDSEENDARDKTERFKLRRKFFRGKRDAFETAFRPAFLRKIKEEKLK